MTDLTGTQIRHLALTLGDWKLTGYSLEELGDLLAYKGDARTLGNGPGDGGQPGPLWLPEHEWTMRGKVYGEKIDGDTGGVTDLDKATRAQARLVTLKSRFGKPAGDTVETEFRWRLFGQDTDSIRMARCVACKPTLDVDALGTGVIPYEITMVASDPTIYGDTIHDTGEISPSGDATATNAGNHAPQSGHLMPSATLTGPLTNPQVTDGDGNGIKYTGTITGGQSLVLNWSTRTAVKTGFVNAYPDLTDPTGLHGPEWFPLNPGDNEIHLDADSGTGNLVFAWRDTSL